MKLTTILLCVAMPAMLAAKGQQLKLKIFEPVDTTAKTSYTVLASTVPGATATINGQEAQVRKTGSFGAQVELKAGDNTITFEVKYKGQKASKSINVFCGKRQKSTAARQPRITSYEPPRTVETLSGAYLQYGNGDDRLGGSKMGFLPAGIPLTAIAKEGSLLKIRLAEGRYAYLPEEYAKAATIEVPAAPVNTGSWSVKTEGSADVVRVNLPVRLPYSVQTSLDPSEIIMDVYGAMDNSNWITQTMPLGIVSYVTFEQTASDIYRVRVRLNQRHQWGYTADYDGNTLALAIRHRPQSLDLKDLTIGLDAGHGGKYSGAVSPSGLLEKTVNLKIVKALQTELQARGAKVVLTRASDIDVSMAERKRILRQAKVDISIAVHNNAAAPRLEGLGTSCYYKHLFDRPLAAALLNRMLQLGLPQYGLVGNFNFSLNGPTDYPNALVECAFMDSLDQEELLADDAYLKKIAHQICLGLEDYLRQAAQD